MKFPENFVSNFSLALNLLNTDNLNAFTEELVRVRERSGRVFIAGVGGSAANASHMVNDLRKLAGIESYSISDNVSELTARVNDEGWETSYSNWLIGSKFGPNDCLCVLSVGGGSKSRKLSMNLVSAIDLALETGSSICGVIGKSDGELGSLNLPAVVVASSPDISLVTPVSETLQAFVWHMAVSDPRLAINKATW
jgi:D-sedoheptulose 7-phosphate isomerase